MRKSESQPIIFNPNFVRSGKVAGAALAVSLLLGNGATINSIDKSDNSSDLPDAAMIHKEIRAVPIFQALKLEI